MFRIAIGLLIVAILAAIFGFGGIAGTAVGFAKIVFVVALVLAVLSFIAGGRGSGAVIALLAAGGLLALPSRASAQEVYGVSSDYRTGFTGGLGVGAGHIACSDEGDACEGLNEAGGIDLHVGAMVDPSVAIVLDLWGMRHEEDRASFSQGIAAAAVRFWPLPRLWLTGGVGVAQASWTYDADVVEFSDETSTVPAVIGGVGVEVLSSARFALDLYLRGGTGFYDDEDVRVRNVQVGLGVSLF